MKSNQKPYKKFSNTNKKKKKEHGEDSGIVSISNSNKRQPIIALPEINTSPILQTYRRFVNNGGAVNGELFISDLLKQFTFATTAVLLAAYVRAVRIKKIRILAPVTTQGTSVTLKAMPFGYDAGQNCFSAVPEVILDTSASIDVPAYIDLSPSKETPLGSWHYATTVDLALLSIECPPGSTMDILFEYVLAVTSDSQPSPFYTRTVAGATPAALYAGTMISVFVPQGVNTI